MPPKSSSKTDRAVSRADLEEYAKKTSGFTAIARDAMDPIYNGDDSLLTTSLWKAAVECAKLGGGKMVMNKHAIAARKAYKTLANALQIDDDAQLDALENSYSEKYLRTFATETVGVAKISPAAIEAVFDPLDKVLSMAVWRLTLELWNNKDLKSTKILLVTHAQSAKAIYAHLRPLLEDMDAFDGDAAASTTSAQSITTTVVNSTAIDIDDDDECDGDPDD